MKTLLQLVVVALFAVGAGADVVSKVAQYEGATRDVARWPAVAVNQNPLGISSQSTDVLGCKHPCFDDDCWQWVITMNAVCAPDRQAACNPNPLRFCMKKSVGETTLECVDCLQN